jgi:hypothetical protein
METALPILAFLAFAAIAIAFGVVGAKAERKRVQDLVDLAARLGLSFSTEKDPTRSAQYAFLSQLNTGDKRYAFDILDGVYRHRGARAFCHHHQVTTRTKNGSRTSHYYHCVFTAQLPLIAPELRIYPENILHRFGQALGFSDINFESVEFSRAFVVKCEEKKFAYDILHSRAMEYLLKHPDLTYEMEGNNFAIVTSGRLYSKEFEKHLNILNDLIDLFPDYLLDQPKDNLIARSD